MLGFTRAERWSFVAGLALLILALTNIGVAAQTQCGGAVVVSPGDTLSRIAARCGTSISALLQANSQVTNPNIIYVGQVLRMPGGQITVGVPQPPPPSLPPGTGGYVVQPGDTFWSIAARFGIPLSALIGTNPNVDPRFLRQGIRIRFPGGYRPPGPPSPTIAVTGTLTREGIECPALRADDGRLYTLVGGTGGFRPGDRVRVSGTQVQFSTCQQGTTIRVGQITAAGGPAPGPVPGTTVTGTMTGEGVECPAMRGDDGRLYTLAGATGFFPPGTRVRVEGERAQASFCQQGTTINVRRVTPLPFG